MSDLRLSALYVHPVKSCAGLARDAAVLTPTGLQYDREWMVVDDRGEFLSQREAPRLALVRTELKHSELVLRAPGMIALHLRLDGAEGECRVQVWNDALPAFDMGGLAAQWFSDFLGIRGLRLAAFDSEAERPSDPGRSRGLRALNAFSDGFPLLVASTASLAELNRRRAEAGLAPVGWERFRPNLVIEGLDNAHDEDHLDELTIHTAEGPVVLKLADPCTRCSIPDVDPATGERDLSVSPLLGTYRALPALGGATAFGMNAMVASGVGRTLRVGDRIDATLAL